MSSSRDKSYISEIHDQSRDSVIARSRVTEALSTPKLLYSCLKKRNKQ